MLTSNDAETKYSSIYLMTNLCQLEHKQYDPNTRNSIVVRTSGPLSLQVFWGYEGFVKLQLFDPHLSLVEFETKPLWEVF